MKLEKINLFLDIAKHEEKYCKEIIQDKNNYNYFILIKCLEKNNLYNDVIKEITEFIGNILTYNKDTITFNKKELKLNCNLFLDIIKIKTNYKSYYVCLECQSKYNQYLDGAYAQREFNYENHLITKKHKKNKGKKGNYTLGKILDNVKFCNSIIINITSVCGYSDLI